MSQRQAAKHLGPCLLALTLGVWVSIDLPASAADPVTEEVRLSALVRQLDVLERIAQQASEAAGPNRGRYHFDYVRLDADIERIRAGIRQYLSPPRAQPRDPSALSGNYMKEDESP